MIKVTNNYAKKKLTVEDIFACDNTCILEDGRIAFCAWMDADLFDRLEKDKKDSILCFTIEDDGETNIEYIRLDTPATPCNVEIKVN